MRVLYHARIRTQNPKQPFATAMAIDHGRVCMIGTDDELLSEFSNVSSRQDMQGKIIWPGLTDAHIHLQHYAHSLQMVNCETDSKEECLRRVHDKALLVPENTWIRGHGWNQNNWLDGFGFLDDLNNAAPNHPVYLTAKSLHAGWANSHALHAAGINKFTLDPEGGRIGRDASGNLNGLLFEAAMELLDKCIPAPTQDEIVRSIDEAQVKLWKFGLTGTHDFDRKQCFSALQTLNQAGKLKLRVVKSIPLENLSHAAEVGLKTGFGNNYLRIGSIKMFSDGALGPRTAAMLQPYENEGENTGMLLMDSEQIFEHGQQAVSNGISIAIHAIGDRANHEVLLAYEQLRRYESENGLGSLRHRIEHAQILHPDDYDKFTLLDIIASVQPVHATSDMHMADRYWGKRSIGAYAYRTLLDRNTKYCFGSDAPVESPNPFLGLHAAVTRRRPDGSPSLEGWYPVQRLSLHEALGGYTTGPAYAAGLENELGRLIPGYFADLIVLDQDPFNLPADDLHQIQPCATMVDGEWVWEANS